MFICFMARDNDSAGRGYLGDTQITVLKEFLPGRKVFSPPTLWLHATAQPMAIPRASCKLLPSEQRMPGGYSVSKFKH